MSKLRIMVIGGGGREHAICHKLAYEDGVGEIIAIPGNPGISSEPGCRSMLGEDAEDVLRMRDIARELRPDLVVVGPEVPLALGVTDLIEELGIAVFGPDKKCAQLEASKSFTKDFLVRHGIPTARHQLYEDADSLKKDIGLYGWPMVIKADGLAAGKGVILAKDAAEAEEAIDAMMETRVFGDAADKVLVEECLQGIEASVMCFVDGSCIAAMESAQDYKRIRDRDEGPNTGGMGSYSPSLLFDDALKKRIEEEILAPTFAGFKEDELMFRGVLFIGIMITQDGPKVIEFNNRFGDPETQSVLARLDSDLLGIFTAVCEDRLSQHEIRWKDEAAVCVVMASGGYPGSYTKGRLVTGLGDVDEDVVVLHAGTAYATSSTSACVQDVCAPESAPGEQIVTAGGRVLGVTATGRTHEEARAKAYDNLKRIDFEDATFRTDIGIVYGGKS